MTKLPDGWETKRLDEIADIVMGQSPPGSTYNENGEGQPFFQGKTEFGEVHPTVRKYTTAGTKFAKAGDILMSVRAPVGPTNIADIDCVIGRGLAAIRAKTVVSQNYLRWSLKHLEIDIQSKGTGTTFDAITGETLRGTLVALPPIDEQNKIVELLEDHLSRLDAALVDVKQAKVKAAQFRRSILHAAFTGNIDSYGDKRVTELPIGWEMRTLSKCLEKLKSGKLAERGWSPQCLSHPTNDENTWGVLKTTSVQMGEYQPQYNKELPESLTPKIGLEVNPGDFLVTTTGPRNRCGIICHVKTTPRKLIFSGKILRFRANEEIVLPNWLLYILMSPEYQTTLDGLKVGTSDSSVSIGNQQILDLVIPVPSIEVQLKILQQLEVNLSNLEASVSLIDSMEKQSGGLRRSLLQAAFSGQLTKEVAIV